RALRDDIEDRRKILDRARGGSFHGPGGNRVDTDLLRAEVAGEVTDRCFEGGFGNSHDVVIRHDSLRSQIRQRENRAAGSHKWRRRSRDSNERVAANLLRKQIPGARSLYERTAQVVTIRERDAVHHRIESTVVAQLRGQPIEFRLLRHITLKDFGRAELLRQFFHRQLQALSLIREDKLRAFAPVGLRDRVSEAPLIGDAEYKRSLSFKKVWHRSVILARKSLVRNVAATEAWREERRI